jgi:hypothetical protein
MTLPEVEGFLKSICPSHVEVESGKGGMIRAFDHAADAEAYIKYSGGLSFAFQGVRAGNKDDTVSFDFKNEGEFVALLGPLVLQCLDGERRV